MAMTNNRPSAMMVQPKPVRAQNTGSSLLSLLDDDVGKPNLLQMAVLRPMVMDLIDLSDDNEQMDFVAPISSWTTTEPGTPGSSCDNSFRIINLDDDMMGDREDGAAMQVNLTQLKKANRILEEQNLHTDNSDCEGVRDVEDLNVSLIVFDSRVQNNKEDESLRNENDPKADKTSQDQKHQGADDENEEQGLVIQRRHLEKLLDEMVGGKNVLQVYASLDTLEMRSILMEPAKEGGGETYGWMLSRLLYEKKRFQESATVIFEYLQPSRGIPSVPNLSSTLNLTSSTSEGWAHPIAIRRYLGLNRLPSSTSSTISSSPSPSASPSKPTAASKTKAPVYQLPRETRIVFVNSSTQLPTLSAALRSSTRVGMDTEWLPHIQEYMGLRPATRTAILQLSCESDSTAYIVDTIAFKESTDRGAGLVQVIGEFLHDSKVVKIAYDWDGDRDLLEATFPLIHQQPYRPQSFMDLKYLWFRSLDGPTPSTPQEDKSQMASYLPSPVSSSSSTSSLSSSSTFSSSSSPTSLPSPALPLLKNGKGQWANYPAVQDMYQLTGGLSGMLTKLCGYRLNKTQQCSHWEQRPLTREQEIYAAVDAWCLLDIYAVLEKMEKLEKI
ncbi:ribonuclease H-like domain-containing protein [Gamsiella multidivaricata]|uniref:ribonuclease H-like domain-containing protein n=1 Tax=Gamsiella multidivaricata TaxID=101098 RepID=UPI002220F745|nr:ribonuclease H-like domain-containing protein [Gamsiella multidivaricata]KAI7831628.1 ribonuclease H-like domain-containing protein [Gamsiella multidivaricata]